MVWYIILCINICSNLGLYNIMYNKDIKKNICKYIYIDMSYYCKKCNFKTTKKNHWTRHLNTKKHMSSSIIFNCEFCDKKYKFRSGLQKHMVKCQILSTAKQTTAELEQKIDMIIKSQEDVNEKINIHLSKPNTVYNNYNNKKMTINVFLNEKCKDAMNLTKFIQNIQISLEDLMYTKNNGYIKGLTNIFTKQLSDLKPDERPIHCSDKKRMLFYVKEDNIWDKDETQIDKSIHDIKMQQIKKLSDWEKLNPNYMQNEKLLNEWQTLIHQIIANPNSNLEKANNTIKKNIAEYVELKDAMNEDEDLKLID